MPLVKADLEASKSTCTGYPSGALHSCLSYSTWGGWQKIDPGHEEHWFSRGDPIYYNAGSQVFAGTGAPRTANGVDMLIFCPPRALVR